MRNVCGLEHLHPTLNGSTPSIRQTRKGLLLVLEECTAATRFDPRTQEGRRRQQDNRFDRWGPDDVPFQLAHDVFTNPAHRGKIFFDVHWRPPLRMSDSLALISTYDIAWLPS